MWTGRRRRSPLLQRKHAGRHGRGGSACRPVHRLEAASSEVSGNATPCRRRMASASHGVAVPVGERIRKNRFANAFMQRNSFVVSTISKVAERAGVSRTTVSHVMNHAERVSSRCASACRRRSTSLATRRTRRREPATGGPPCRHADPGYPQSLLSRTGEDRTVGAGAIGLDTLVFNTDVPGGHSQSTAGIT